MKKELKKTNKQNKPTKGKRKKKDGQKERTRKRKKERNEWPDLRVAVFFSLRFYGPVSPLLGFAKFGHQN